MSRATLTLHTPGTGENGSDEVHVFTEETAPLVAGREPLLRSLSHNPGIIEPGGILFSDSWKVTLSDRVLDTGGTFWGRFFARIPHLYNRRAVIHWTDGDQDLEYVVYGVSRERGQVVLELTTPIREVLSTKIAEFARPVRTTAAIAEAQSQTDSVALNRDLPFETVLVRIDDEIIQVSPGSRGTDTLDLGTMNGISWRARAGTERAAHDSGAQVFPVLHLQGTIPDVVEEILGIVGLAEYVDGVTFRESELWLRPITLDGYIVEATKLDDLLKSILEMANASVVWDEFEGKIKFISEVVWTRTPQHVIDENNLLGGRADWSSTEQPQRQFTRCAVEHNSGGRALNTDNLPVALYVDETAESDAQYGVEKPKTIDGSTLINHTVAALAENSAALIAERIVAQHRDPPKRIIGLELFGADGRAVRAGDVVRVVLDEFRQNEDGDSIAVEALVQQVQRDILGNTSTIRLTEYGRYIPEFSPDEIIISTVFGHLNLATAFGNRTTAFTGKVRVVPGGILYGTSPGANGDPAISTGDLPDGTEIEIIADGGLILGNSGTAGRRNQNASYTPGGDGGDVIHVTSGKIKMSCINGGLIYAGGGGGAPGGDGAPRAGQSVTFGIGGDGGTGTGWSTIHGQVYGLRALGNIRGQDGTQAPGSTAIGGFGGGYRAELENGITVIRDRPATDGGDAPDNQDGGGGGGGRGGVAAGNGLAGGSGGDSGTRSGDAAGTPGAGGKLARVAATAEFEAETSDACIQGDVVGIRNEPLRKVSVQRNAIGDTFNWVNPDAASNSNIYTVIQSQIGGVNTQVSRTRGSSTGSWVNTTSATVSYRVRAELPGRIPSDWSYVTLVPQTLPQLADPVVTVNAAGDIASFSVPTSPGAPIFYRVRYRDAEGNYQLFRRYRAGIHSIGNSTGSDQAYDIRAEQQGKTPSNLVTFNLKTRFVGALNVSTNNLTITPGSTGTFDISVSQSPTSNVTISTATSNSNITVSGGSFTITPQNWQTAKTVTVTAPSGGGSAVLTVTASGGEYDGDTATVNVLSSGGVSAPSEASIPAGDSSTLTYGLTERPYGVVTVDISSSSDDVTVTPTSDTIDPATWDTAPATFEVTVDDDAEDDATYTLTVTYTGGGYNQSVTTEVIVANPFEITVESSGTLPYSNTDTTGTVSIKLSAQPDQTEQVIVTVIGEGSVGQYSNPGGVSNASRALDEAAVHLFTTSNWDVAQQLDLNSGAGATYIHCRVVGKPRIENLTLTHAGVGRITDGTGGLGGTVHATPGSHTIELVSSWDHSPSRYPTTISTTGSPSHTGLAMSPTSLSFSNSNPKTATLTVPTVSTRTTMTLNLRATHTGQPAVTGTLTIIVDP